MPGLRSTALLLMVGLSGCFTELLEEETVTVRTFACASLGDDRPVLFELHREQGVPRVPLEALDRVASFLMMSGFGDAERFTVEEGGLLDADGPWTTEALQAWAGDAPVLGSNTIRLHVLWVASFEDEGLTAANVAPGVVAVSEAAVQAGAANLGHSEDFLAEALMWHVVGHALGAVNHGIPLAGRDPAAQEGPPGHEPDPASVLHVSWHRVSTLLSSDVSLAFSEDVVDDWRTAVETGVCA